MQVLVDCSGEGMEKNPETAFINKKSALLQLAEESPVAKTIVFCNKVCSTLISLFMHTIQFISYSFSAIEHKIINR